MPDRVMEITSLLDGVDLSRMATRLGELEGLKGRVFALEKANAREGGKGPRGEALGSDEQLGAMSDALDGMQVTIDTMAEDVHATIDAFKNELAEMNAKINLAVRAMGPHQGADARKVKVPEPQAFVGARNAKELENFLFDIEQYFRAVRPDSEQAKVDLATMYLSGDAKLWWRTKYHEIQRNVCTIDTWEDLKKELRAQFFPDNVEYIARRQLRGLQHTNNIREYVSKFAALMLDLPDMAEKDRLFYFLEGLKPWARQELQRQRVQDLASAQAAAERLTDYSFEETNNRRSQTSSGANGNRTARPGQSRSGGAESRFSSPGGRGNNVRDTASSSKLTSSNGGSQQK